MGIYSEVGSQLEILYVWIRTALGDVNDVPICSVKVLTSPVRPGTETKIEERQIRYS